MLHKKKIIFIILIALTILIFGSTKVNGEGQLSYNQDDLVVLNEDYWTSPHIYCLNAHRKNPETKDRIWYKLDNGNLNPELSYLVYQRNTLR